MVQICPRTMRECTTASMCSPYGGCSTDADDNRVAILERQIAELRAERDKARARVVAAWNAFAGDVADDYAETTDVALVAGGDLDEQIRSLTEQRDNFEAENARLRDLPLKDEVERVLREHIKVDATGMSPLIASTFMTGFEEASTALLARLRAGEQEGRDGLSEWAGWDKTRDPWGETKHKDAVLEALFRGPWSVEDAAALIGFIDRTWPERPAAPSDQGGDRG